MRHTLSCFSPRDLRRIRSESLIRRLEFYHELPSTSDRALECAAANEGDLPMLVLSEMQTAGRGRGQNRWWSARGALTFSLVIDAAPFKAPPERLPQVSLATALGVCESLGTLRPDFNFRLKWPNDVYLNDRKVAGVLVERQTLCPDRIVLGVGINVNNSFSTSSAPDPLCSTATSLRDETEEDYILTDVLLDVLRRIAVGHAMLAARQLNLAEQLRPYCLLRDRTVVVTAGDWCVAGRCCGVDDTGALAIEDEAGRLVRLFSGTVERVGS